MSVNVSFQRLTLDVPPSIEPNVLWSWYCSDSFSSGISSEGFFSRRLLIDTIAQLCLSDVCVKARKVAFLTTLGPSLELDQHRACGREPALPGNGDAVGHGPEKPTGIYDFDGMGDLGVKLQ